jgi:ABC-2 type transport system ATP-binding protein
MPGNTLEYIIRTNGITKLYGNLKAVDNVSINVQKGEIYGFLGLNGAGKTTTIRMLLGMIKADSGESFICGRKIRSGKGPWEKVGYLVEMPYSYPELTVKENLQIAGQFRGLDNSKINDTVKMLQLSQYENVKADNLSLGNKQRLGLAKALVHNPEVLILDEPSNGLDPSGIVEVRELLKDLAFNNGVTVFISSHNLSEISKIATRIGIIHQGSLVQEINADKLDLVLYKTLLLDTRDRIGAVSFLNQQGYKVEYTDDGIIRIADAKACENPEVINSLLAQSGFPPCYLNAVQEDLESYFLRIIGEKK